MQIARYLHDGGERVGLVDGDTVCEVDWSMRDLLVLAAVGRETELAPRPGRAARVDDVVLLPPLVPGSRVFCVGINYREHQEESADVFVAKIPEDPIVFLKDGSAIAPADAVLHLPKEVSEQFDWEVELGVVIGAPARAVPEERALDAVAGFTVVNDVTARDLQTRHVQWTLGKNSVAATPVGPWIVTKSVTGPRPELDMTLHVNDELKQSGNTRDLIFDVPRLISTISSVTPLLPGDVIATGTPSGVGFKRTPPEYLQHDDVVEAHIEGIGRLANRVRTSSHAGIN